MTRLATSSSSIFRRSSVNSFNSASVMPSSVFGVFVLFVVFLVVLLLVVVDDLLVVVLDEEKDNEDPDAHLKFLLEQDTSLFWTLVPITLLPLLSLVAHQDLPFLVFKQVS